MSTHPTASSLEGEYVASLRINQGILTFFVYGSHSLGECRTFARNRYTLPHDVSDNMPLEHIGQVTPVIPARDFYR